MIVELGERGSAYLRYRLAEVAATEEVGLEVLVDRDVENHVIGIEIVDVAIGQSIDEARTFASVNHLDFPKDLGAAAKAL